MPNYKKQRKPNPFKSKKMDELEGKIKPARGEKIEMKLPGNKRAIQKENLTVTSASTIKKEDRQLQELLLERPLTLKELIIVKKIQKTIVSKKPAKIKCEESEDVVIKERKPRKQTKGPKILSKKKLERMLNAQMKSEELESTKRLDIKKRKQEKAKAKKERVLTLQSKSKEIEKEKAKKQSDEPIIPVMPKGAPRKFIRSAMNGRVNGRKNRQKNRIMTLRKSEREFLETYTTKKGKEKNRYVHIQNPEVRKVVVLDRTKPLPVFEKQKTEE
jgi:hypothetical protein